MAIRQSTSDDYEDSNRLQLPTWKGTLFHYTPNILPRSKYNATVQNEEL